MVISPGRAGILRFAVPFVPVSRVFAFYQRSFSKRLTGLLWIAMVHTR